MALVEFAVILWTFTFPQFVDLLKVLMHVSGRLVDTERAKSDISGSCMVNLSY